MSILCSFFLLLLLVHVHVLLLFFSPFQFLFFSLFHFFLLSTSLLIIRFFLLLISSSPHFLFFLFALLYLLGTPIQNNLEELYAVVQFTVPGYLSSVSDYRKYFAEPISKGQLSRATEREKKEVSVDISNTLFIFDTNLFPSSAGVSA